VKRLLTLIALLCAVPAFPQGFELTALGGYTTPGGLAHDTRVLEDLRLGGSLTWGASAGYFVSPHLGIEASWARVGSGIELATTVATQEMFDVTIDQVQGSFVYQFGNAESRWRPFLTAGAGAALFGSPDLESEAKLSFNVGGGLKWLPSKRFGGRLQAKYSPTHLNDAGSDSCDPFGFCQDWLHQFELTGGVVFRF